MVINPKVYWDNIKDLEDENKSNYIRRYLRRRITRNDQ
jgi:hypothetical protein